MAGDYFFWRTLYMLFYKQSLRDTGLDVVIGSYFFVYINDCNVEKMYCWCVAQESRNFDHNANRT